VNEQLNVMHADCRLDDDGSVRKETKEG